jgi:2-phospho-L-lactate guanylyltransferase
VRTLAVVPVQRLSLAKSRLAGRLGSEARQELMRWLLERLLGELRGARRVGDVLVVSPDPAVLVLAERAGARPRAQAGSGLNAAVALGQRVALAEGWPRLLVVLADVPLLVAEQVDRMLALAQPGRVVIAPDRHGLGTNLLALCPPDAVAPLFGQASRQRHARAARESGRRVVEYWSTGTAHDLDTPEDLEELESRWGWTVESWITGEGGSRWRSGIAG